MAIVVEDGTGLANAESYNSVAAITAYNAAHNQVAAWNAAVEADQERHARLAAQYMDARYLTRVKGARFNPNVQRLLFPRYGIYVDGALLVVAPLPRQWLEAHCELSIKSVSEPLMPDIASPGSIKSESKRLDTLEKSVEYVGGKSQIKWFRLADKLVAPLLSSADRMERA
jgi:hypothetical protein